MLIIEKLKSIENYEKINIVIPHSKHYLSTGFFYTHVYIFIAIEIIIVCIVYWYIFCKNLIDLKDSMI